MKVNKTIQVPIKSWLGKHGPEGPMRISGRQRGGKATLTDPGDDGAGGKLPGGQTWGRGGPTPLGVAPDCHRSPPPPPPPPPGETLLQWFPPLHTPRAGPQCPGGPLDSRAGDWTHPQGAAGDSPCSEFWMAGKRATSTQHGTVFRPSPSKCRCVQNLRAHAVNTGMCTPATPDPNPGAT